VKRLALGAALLALVIACKRPAPAGPPAVLDVPRAHGGFDLDGEIDEAEWHSAARTGQLTDADRGKPVRPYSDARVLVNGSSLLLALYAADENVLAQGGRDAILGSDDRFVVRLRAGGTSHELLFSAGGAVQLDGKPAGIPAGIDLDGTVNDRSDMDEEWVVETAVPLRSLGISGSAGAVGFEVSRCDTTLDGWHACGRWPAAGDGILRFGP
jgi:hypothetical protein